MFRQNLDVLGNDAVENPFGDGRARWNPKCCIGVIGEGGEFGEIFMIVDR